MRRLVTAMLIAQLAMISGASVRVEHEGEEPAADDLVKELGNRRKIEREPKLEPIYLRPPRVEHKPKSKALARMLKSKGCK